MATHSTLHIKARSYTRIHTPTAVCEPCKAKAAPREQSGSAVSLRDTSTLHSLELATFRLAIKPLYLLSRCRPYPRFPIRSTSYNVGAQHFQSAILCVFQFPVKLHPPFKTVVCILQKVYTEEQTDSGANSLGLTYF